MHTIIYLTGPQGSGKSILAMGFRSASEVAFEIGNLSRVRKEVESSFGYKEIVVVTGQNYELRAEEWLTDLANQHKLNFYSIGLRASNSK